MWLNVPSFPALQSYIGNRKKMSKEFDVIIERDSEGYFVGSVPTLPGCHTQAKSPGELMERIREAIELCLEFTEDQAEALEFIGVQRVSVKV